MHSTSKAATAVILAILNVACNDPETQSPATNSCQPFADDEVGGGCTDTGDTDTEGALAPDECIYTENLAFDGYRIQCEGEYHSKIDFNILNKNCDALLPSDFCSQTYLFGPPYDTYEAPDVMACCGEEWDKELYLDIYQDACMKDLAGQACASMAKRLEKHIEAGDFNTANGDFTDKATNLQAYVAAHYIECVSALHDNDSAPAAGELVSHWNIPNMAGPNGWWPAQDIVISVEAGTEVTDGIRPESQENWIECHGAFDNNDEIFEDQNSPNGGIVVDVSLDTSVDGDLVGPTIGGGAATASTTFATTCVDQGCPGATWSFETTGAEFTMEEFNLYASYFVVTNGTSSLTVNRARVELWTQADGTKVFDGTGALIGYEIPAGEAWFYMAGMADGVYSQFMGVNSTDIEMTEDSGIWDVSAFDIESVDGANRVWTLTVDYSTWEE